MKRRLATLLIAATLVTAPREADAGEPPFSERPVSISARGEDVRTFLADLFGQSGLRVKVSTGVAGKVNGTFAGPPARVWAQLARAYGLVGYWDGAIMRIYAQSEIGTRSIATATPVQLAGEVRRLGLSDATNVVQTGSALVVATGVPEFLQRVEDLAGATRLSAGSSGRGGSGSPALAGGAVASPLLALPARAPVRSRVTAPAGTGSPFEVRMFFLKYRDAADRQLTSSDRITVVPGVASLLREQMGDGRGVSTASTNQYRISDLDRSQEYGGWGSGVPYAARPDGVLPGYGGDPAVNSAAAAAALAGLTNPEGARISADPTNNAVIVRDRPERMGVYEQLIANLDTEPVMIEIEATIIEVSTEALRQLGIDWNLGVGGLRLAFGGEVGGPTPGASNVGGSYLSGNGDSFVTRIRALQQRGALRVVARPVLSTPTNQVAVFDDTTQQFARITGEREVALKTITYGLSMRVQPSAIEDGSVMRIRLAVEIADTRLNGLVVDGIPLYSGPRISTQSIVRHGEAVLIAGITSDTQYDYKSKVPLLGDIPIAGQVFRKRNKGDQHFERLFLITPRIVSSRVPGRPVAKGPPPLPLEVLRGGMAKGG
ncbi:type III secretion system outer membrane ring subunit SctC [Sphingomonas sp. DT-51]|uniref:type III secretion system outer membrane ring subunit SctC n=1 Tax=Sphingomonas sp. DT-51 TaxID=3396165 RepID=UPI003F193586